MGRGILMALLLWAALPATAHRASDAFVTAVVSEGGLEGHWEIALRDLEAAVGVDLNRDRNITWRELRAVETRLPELLKYVEFSTGGGACSMRLGDLKVNERADGPYAWLPLSGECPAAAGLSVRYRFLFDLDPSHRAILSLRTGSGVTATAVLAPDNERFTLTPGAAGRLEQFGSYLREGMVHIWAGYDHVLFLVTLLLPCVLLWLGGGWESAPRIGPALREVVLVVTAFTVAHSLTLGLAVLDLVALPSRLVESVIALTVVLAALNNLYPLVTRRRYAVAFAFGLLHGFGFASALGELGLPGDARFLALAGFNIGVELGQLAIVFAVVPALYALRSTRIYRPLVLRGGSLGVAALAAVWLFERAVLGV